MTNKQNSFTLFALISLVAFGIYHLCYIHAVTVNVAWLTWFEQTPRLEKALDNTLKFKDLFTQYGEHGMFGYNCLAIFNVKYLALNAFFDAYLYLAASLVFAALVIQRVYKHISLEHKGLWIATPLLCFVWFVVTQKSAGAMDTQVRLSLCFIVLNMLLLDRLLSESARPTWLQLVTFSAVFVATLVVFGTLYSFGWVSALLLVTAFRAWGTKTFFTRDLALVASLILGCASYLWLYPLPPTQASSPGLTATFLASVTHPINSYKFFVAFLGNGLVGFSVWVDDFPNRSTYILLNGSIVAAIYAISIVLFFRYRIYRRSWLPLFMLMHPIGVGLMLQLGRSALLGWQGGMNDWYGIHHRLGLSGIILVFLFVYDECYAPGSLPRYFRPLLAALALYAAPLLYISERAEWSHTSFIRSFFEGMVLYAQNPTPTLLDAEGKTPMKASYSDTMRSLNFYKKYKLNLFTNRESTSYGQLLIENGACTNPEVLGIGWYSQEGKGRWMAKRSEFTTVSGPEGTFVIAGFAPTFQQGGSLDLTASSGETVHMKLIPGLFSVMLKVKPHQLTTVVMNCSYSNGSNKDNDSPDKRELALVINSVSAY